MQRDLPAILGGLFLLVIVAIIMYSNNGSKGLSLSDSNSIPTSGILGTTTTPEVLAQNTVTPTMSLLTNTPSLTPTPTITPSKTPSPTPPTPRATNSPTPSLTQLKTCNSSKSAMIEKAKIFMNLHKERKALDAIFMISAPISDTDQIQKNFWTGEDDNVAPRLYQTTPTSYVTTSFNENGVMGQPKQERGTILCQLTIRETRETTDQDGTKSTSDRARYIDFSLDQNNGDFEITAFKESSSGTKYSGFNPFE